MTNPSLLLEVKNLCVKLEQNKQLFPVVENLSFSLYEGKTLAIVGESGSGKSVAASAIAQLLPMPPFIQPTGEVIYKGQNLLTVDKKQMRLLRGHKIGMIFQNPMNSLNPILTVKEQLSEVLIAHGITDKTIIYESMIAMLKEVQFSNPETILEQYPHQMSGGMQQRIMIAMALIMSPDILIADEPTTALDVTIQAQIIDLLKHLLLTKKMTLLIITHDIGIVAEIADDVLILYAGQQLEKAPVLEIFDNPLHPYTKALFASIPKQHISKQGRLPHIKNNMPSIFESPKTGCKFAPRCPKVMKHCFTDSIKESFPNKLDHSVKCKLYE